MLLGYNTNGLAHHRPRDAVELLAKIGYRSVAITLDHGLVNPYAEAFDRQRVRFSCESGEGGRYLLGSTVGVAL